MRLLQIRCIAIFVMCGSIPYAGVSQVLAPDSTFSPAVRNALAFYNTTLSQQLHIYDGPEYHDYVHTFLQGQPYFIQDKWSKGTVSYDGNLYDDVSILYNTVTDNVVILANNNVSKIELIKDKVAAFSLLGHSFLHLSPGTAAGENLSRGFYDLLVPGKTQLLARRTKSIQVEAKQVLEYNVLGKDRYFLKSDKGYVPVYTKKSLLKQLGNSRKELQHFVKQNKLRFRKDSEHSMIEVVRYYNQIN